MVAVFLRITINRMVKIICEVALMIYQRIYGSRFPELRQHQNIHLWIWSNTSKLLHSLLSKHGIFSKLYKSLRHELNEYEMWLNLFVFIEYNYMLNLKLKDIRRWWIIICLNSHINNGRERLILWRDLWNIFNNNRFIECTRSGVMRGETRDDESSSDTVIYMGDNPIVMEIIIRESN